MVTQDLLSRGGPLPAVSARLGHADVNVTARVYSYALPADDQRAADAWASLDIPVQWGWRPDLRSDPLHSLGGGAEGHSPELIDRAPLSPRSVVCRSIGLGVSTFSDPFRTQML